MYDLRIQQSTVLDIRALVRARPRSLNIGSKYLSLARAKQRLRAEVI